MNLINFSSFYTWHVNHLSYVGIARYNLNRSPHYPAPSKSYSNSFQRNSEREKNNKQKKKIGPTSCFSLCAIVVL